MLFAFGVSSSLNKKKTKVSLYMYLVIHYFKFLVVQTHPSKEATHRSNNDDSNNENTSPDYNNGSCREENMNTHVIWFSMSFALKQ